MGISIGGGGGSFGGPSSGPEVYAPPPTDTTTAAVMGNPLGALAIGLNPVAMAVTAATYGMAAYESYEAGEEAKDAADRAAETERETTAEQVRVAEEENRRVESLAKAKAAASGLSGASSELYVSALAESGREDIDWLKKVGESRVQSTLDQGRAAFHQARAQMWGNIGGAVSTVGRFSGYFG